MIGDARRGAWDPFVAEPASCGLALDFDGTLAAIVDDPARARALPGSLATLARLVRHLGLVAVVSGRPVSFLAEHVVVERIVLVGQYGLEILVDGQLRSDPRAAAFAAAVDAAAREVATRWPDLLVERKGQVAATVHWRTRPERAPDPHALEDLAGRFGLVAFPARMACELRPPVPVDKGTALEALVRGRSVRALAFCGDDAGDLAAFAALDRLVACGAVGYGLRIAVASAEAPAGLLARADLVVDGPDDLARLLDGLADTLDRT